MSFHLAKGGVGLLAAAAIFSITPAIAQKSNDTVRIGVDQPVSLADHLIDSQPQTRDIVLAVFDSLLWYDGDKGKFGGLLAESWKRIDDKTMEFTLRQGVKFHDGAEFDADDVVASVSYNIDPKVNFRFKENRYGWIDGVEKLGKYTVRIRSKDDYAPFETSVALNMGIYPKSRFQMDDPTQFGKAPVGTGAFRVTDVGTNVGVKMERWDDYKHGGELKPAAQVSRIHWMPIPDRQAQVANMLTGNQDLMYQVQSDQLDALRDHADLKVHVGSTVWFAYLYVDAVNRSGVGVFQDERVRRAVYHAIDRQGMFRGLAPKEAWDWELPTGMCNKWHVACDHTAQPADHDPAKARALLAEAGWDSSKELQILTFGPTLDHAQAVAGYLREVGIRASVDAVPNSVYNKKRGEGQAHMILSSWDNGGAQPDVGNTARFFLAKSPREYHHDTTLYDLTARGDLELDHQKRMAIYREAFNRATEQAYFHPLVPLPALVVHNKDLVIHGGHRNQRGFEANRISWAK